MPSPTLLLVEDSAEDAALIVSALAGLLSAEQIILCETGEEALDYLLQGGERPAHGHIGPVPHLTLLDLNLPRMNGIQVLNRIRAEERTRLMPVIMLSASVAKRDVHAATMAGANSYVRKSLDHAKLAEAIQLVARYWLDLNIGPHPHHAVS